MTTSYSGPRRGQPGMRNRAPSKASAVLAQALRRYGLDKEISKYQFVAHWGDIVGVEVAKRTKPEQIRGAVLVVRVSNSIWAQELSMRKEVILQRLRDFARELTTVNDIQFVVGRV